MDRDRFDALARLLGAEGSRRTALCAVLGAAVAVSHLPAVAKPKKQKKRRRKQPPTTCFGTKACRFPSDGQDFEDCTFAGESLGDCNGCTFRGADLSGADLSEGSYQGASFRAANLRGANFEDADVSGVSFRFACLVDATLEGANADGAHFGGAILCNTTLPDGSVSNSGCEKATACCPADDSTACTKDAECGGTQPYCCDNACSEFCCLDSQCPDEQSCDEGVCEIPNPTCAVDPNACEDGFVVCGGTGGADTCFCYVTTEGVSRCLRINQATNPFCAGTPCDSSDDCGPGQRCASLDQAGGICCTAKICGPDCAEFANRSRRAATDVGPPRP